MGQFDFDINDTTSFTRSNSVVQKNTQKIISKIILKNLRELKNI